VESSLTTDREKFIDAGNRLIDFPAEEADSEAAPALETLDTGMVSAEIVQKVEAAMSEAEKPENGPIGQEEKSAIEMLKKNLCQFEADGAVTSLIILARKAKRENQKLIIGLETDWIPGMEVKGNLQKKAMTALMKEIYSIGKAVKSMGLDNVKVIHGRGSYLAHSLIKAAKNSHTDMRNIVVMASKYAIEKSIGFRAFREADEKNRPFLTGIDPVELVKLYEEFGESVSKQLHIKLASLLYMTLEVAAGKEPPEAPWIHYDRARRILILVPSAKPMDYQALQDTYKAELAALAAA